MRRRRHGSTSDATDEKVKLPVFLSPSQQQISFLSTLPWTLDSDLGCVGWGQMPRFGHSCGQQTMGCGVHLVQSAAGCCPSKVSPGGSTSSRSSSQQCTVVGWTLSGAWTPDPKGRFQESVLSLCNVLTLSILTHSSLPKGMRNESHVDVSENSFTTERKTGGDRKVWQVKGERERKEVCTRERERGICPGMMVNTSTGLLKRRKYWSRNGSPFPPHHYRYCLMWTSSPS